jgi:hypothetical protein
MFEHTTQSLRRAGLALAATLPVLIAGCANYDSSPTDGIGFREARYNEMAAAKTFRDCRDEAVDLDRQARQSGSTAKYLASARMLEACEAEVGPDVAVLAEDERMRGYALSIQNYFKGGDVATARANLQLFESRFAGQDLYYPDGSSFTETMEILLGMRDRTDMGAMAMINVSQDVRSELRRARHWKQN